MAQLAADALTLTPPTTSSSSTLLQPATATPAPPTPTTSHSYAATPPPTPAPTPTPPTLSSTTQHPPETPPPPPPPPPPLPPEPSAAAARRCLRAAATTAFTNRLGATAVAVLVDLLVVGARPALRTSCWPRPAPGAPEWHAPPTHTPHPASPCARTQDLVLPSTPAPASTPPRAPSWQALRALRRHPPVCLAPGAPVASSRVLRGVLLHQGLASRHMALPGGRWVHGAVGL